VLNQDFKEFIKSLNDNSVRYLVVGGYAVALHGYPRYTKDMDVWVEMISENASKIIIIESLKKNKKASGRHQDLADLENLE